MRNFVVAVGFLLVLSSGPTWAQVPICETNNPPAHCATPAPASDAAAMQSSSIANPGDPFQPGGAPGELQARAPVEPPTNRDGAMTAALGAMLASGGQQRKYQEVLGGTRGIAGVPPSIASDPGAAVKAGIVDDYAGYGARDVGVQAVVGALMEIMTKAPSNHRALKSQMLEAMQSYPAEDAVKGGQIVADYLTRQRKAIEAAQSGAQGHYDPALIAKIRPLVTALISASDKVAAGATGRTTQSTASLPVTDGAQQVAAGEARALTAQELETLKVAIALSGARPDDDAAALTSSGPSAEDVAFQQVSDAYARYGMREAAVAETVKKLQLAMFDTADQARGQQRRAVQAAMADTDPATAQKALLILSDWTAKQVVSTSDVPEIYGLDLQLVLARVAKTEAVIATVLQTQATTQQNILANLDRPGGLSTPTPSPNGIGASIPVTTDTALSLALDVALAEDSQKVAYREVMQRAAAANPDVVPVQAVVDPLGAVYGQILGEYVVEGTRDPGVQHVIGDLLQVASNNPTVSTTFMAQMMGNITLKHDPADAQRGAEITEDYLKKQIAERKAMEVNINANLQKTADALAQMMNAMTTVW